MSDPNPIRRDQLVAMFDGMRAQAPWNVDGPLLWGYFFFAAGPAPLEAMGRELIPQGYRQVALRPLEEGDKPTGEYVLHLEKVDHHTVDSLHRRNGELSTTAASYGARYDGMDVGPAR